MTPENRSSTQRRLWKVGGLVGILILTLAIGNLFLPADRAVTRSMIGHDFLVFYTAGTFARTAQSDKLYDVDATNAFESQTGRAAGLAIGKTYGPWWNPPFAAWAFAPLSLLPFQQALKLWFVIDAIALAASVALLARYFPAGITWRTWGLIPLLLCTSGPFWGVISHGQNTLISLLILTMAVACWRRRQGLFAGMIAGLLLYKPQLGAVVGIAMIVTLGAPALLGYLCTAGSLVLVTLVTQPGVAMQYVHQLPHTLVVTQETGRYFWDRHVTLKAFWRLLVQGWTPGSMSIAAKLCWYASEGILSTLLGLAALAVRRDETRLDRFIAATIVGMPLLMPFYFDYDLLLLAIPCVLGAADAMRTAPDRRLSWGWIILAGSLLISTQIAGKTGFILAVPLLAAMSLLLIAKTVMMDEAIPHALPMPTAVRRAKAAGAIDAPDHRAAVGISA